MYILNSSNILNFTILTIYYQTTLFYMTPYYIMICKSICIYAEADTRPAAAAAAAAPTQRTAVTPDASDDFRRFHTWSTSEQ